jgi:WD40 repeat protein
LSWKEIFAFDHTFGGSCFEDGGLTLTEGNTPSEVNIYVENESIRDGSSVYDIGKKPFKVPQLPQHQVSVGTKGDMLPKVGISLIAISHDQRYCATKSELHPLAVFIWDLTRLTLNSLMLQKHEVTHLAWCPLAQTLNVSTGSGRLFLWTERVASVCQVPVSRDNFGVGSVRWNPNGKSFAAIDRSGLVFVYPQVAFFGEQ